MSFEHPVSTGRGKGIYVTPTDGNDSIGILRVPCICERNTSIHFSLGTLFEYGNLAPYIASASHPHTIVNKIKMLIT